MEAVGAAAELAVIFLLVCTSALLCTLHTGTLKQTFNIYVFDGEMGKSFRSEFGAEDLVPMSEDTPSSMLVEMLAEFEDTNLDVDYSYDVELLTFEDETNESRVSILCWLALETTYQQDPDNAMLMWRAPCYQETKSEDSYPSAECHLEVSKAGDFTISFADTVVAYRSNTTGLGVEYMVLSEENEILLLNEDHKTVWSSEENNFFNCID